MQEQIEKIGNLFEKWFKPLPHLPALFAKTFAENIWWMILVGLFFLAMAIITSIGAVSVANTTANYIDGVLGIYGTTVSGARSVTVASTVSIVFMVISFVVLAVSVAPVKNLTKKGWELLMVSLIIGTVSMIVSAVMSGLGGFFTTLIGGILAVAVTAYFLSEIRIHFKNPAKAEKKLDDIK